MKEEEKLKELEIKVKVQQQIIERLKETIIWYQNTHHIETQIVSNTIIETQRYNLDMSIRQLDYEYTKKIKIGDDK